MHSCGLVVVPRSARLAIRPHRARFACYNLDSWQVTMSSVRTSDEQDVDELRGKQVAVAAQEAAVVRARVGGRRNVAVRVIDQVLGGEQAWRDEAPRAVPAMHGDGVQRIVQVQNDRHLPSITKSGQQSPEVQRQTGWE